jgi:hypothetical protein
VIVDSIFPASIFNNNAAIEVTNGTIDVRGVAGGTGNYQIDGTGTLAFGRKTGDGLSILFYGTGGTLQIGTTGTFAAGYIGGFAQGDSIDLKNFAYSSSIQVSYSDNMLVVSVGKRTAKLNLVGDYAAASFVAASDGATGTVITYSPATVGGVARSSSALGHHPNDSRVSQFASAIAVHSSDNVSFHEIHRPHGTGDAVGPTLLAASAHP